MTLSFILVNSLSWYIHSSSWDWYISWLINSPIHPLLTLLMHSSPLTQIHSHLSTTYIYIYIYIYIYMVMFSTFRYIFMDLKSTFPSILENFTFSLILFGLMYDTSLQHANIESMFFFFFLFSIRYLSTTC